MKIISMDKMKILTTLFVIIGIIGIFAKNKSNLSEAQTATAIPDGVIMFLNLNACPPGMVELVAARGRYFVGGKPTDSIGATIGRALLNEENRPTGAHSHNTVDGFELGQGSVAAGFVNVIWFNPFLKTVKGTVGGGRDSVTNNRLVSGTNAPYIQLLPCIKQQAPSLSFTSDKELGGAEPVLLSWVVKNAATCVASGSWSGSKNPIGGSEEITITRDSTFNLKCTNSLGNVSKTVAVQGEPPVLSFTSNIGSEEGSIELNWLAENALTCAASRGWSGDKPLQGSETLLIEQLTDDFILTCNNNVDNTSKRITLRSLNPTLSFSADKTKVALFENLQLSWVAENSSACVASGSWSGEKPSEGSETVSAKTFDDVFTLTCSNSIKSVTEEVRFTSKGDVKTK